MLSSDRRQSLVLAGAGAVLLAASIFSVLSAVTVWRDRRAVERNVRLLVRLQQLNEELVSERRAPQAPLFDELAAHPDPGVAASVAGLEKALAARDADPSPELSRAALASIGQAVAALRRANAALSEQLGGAIDRLYVTVALLVVLAAFTMTLVWRTQRDARLLAKLADARVAAAQAEHGQRLEMVNTLAASVAHEVNNPMTAVLLSLQHLRQNEESMRPELRESIDVAIDASSRVRTIVATLRNLAAPGNGGEVELNRAVESTLRLLQHRVSPRAGVVLKLAGNERVRGSYVGVGQVLSNALVNAVESFGDRPLEQNEIVIETSTPQPGWVEVAVADNGPGFAPETLAKVTTPFFTTKPTGSGLGLFVCKRLVEGFGGELRIEPAAVGARIVIRLQRIDPGGAARAAP